MSYYDNSRYGISYYDYGISLLNKTENEFFADGKLSLEGNYTLNQVIDKLMEEAVNKKGEPTGVNNLGLPIALVSWWPDPENDDPIDAPIDYTNTVYRAFFSRFFNRQINQQTIDSHKLKLQQFFLGHQQSLILKYKAYTQDKLKTKTKRDHTQDGGTTVTTLTRGANSTVPENQVDVDVASTNLEYADDFSKSKQDVKTTNDGTDTNTTNTASDKDLQFALNLPGELESLYRDAEKAQLFMQA